MSTRRFGMAVVGLCLAVSGWGKTFGTVVALGGHATDLALDESRSVVYVANYTANRIDVVSTSSGALTKSMNVAAQPSAVALSRDNRYLVVCHYAEYASSSSDANGLTVFNLDAGTRRSFSLSAAPFGVAFGSDGYALVVTATSFIRFNAVTGTQTVLASISDVAATTLPVAPATLPTEVIGASVQASTDGTYIYGVTDSLLFYYDVYNHTLKSAGYYADPVLGPRAVSVSADGSYYMAGYGRFDRAGLLDQFDSPMGDVNYGGHAIDSANSIIYAEVPQTTETVVDTVNSLPAAVLKVAAADNLQVTEQIQLPEHLAGKAVLSSDNSVMYALSESGLMILKVGSLSAAHRVKPSQKTLLFKSSACESSAQSQEFTIVNPGGGSTAFTLTSASDNVTVSPSSGTTPATVTVTVDTAAYADQSGTSAVTLTLTSTSAVNVPENVTVLINAAGPEQRGTLVRAEGTLVDILPDPARSRFFVLRQDTNEVLVYDGASYELVSTLRTGAKPVSMAISYDDTYLLIGNHNSQYANVYDLETLTAQTSIRFPSGHYPRWLAASGSAILAAVRSADGTHTIDKVNFSGRAATTYSTLGIYTNSISEETALAASANGSTIVIAGMDGNVMLYDANADTFTVSRMVASSLGGAIAASSYDQYVVDSTLYNASLVAQNSLADSIGTGSGAVFYDEMGLLSGASSSSGVGYIARLDMSAGTATTVASMKEAPVLSDGATLVFTRTMALLADRSVIVNLTTSGLTVLAWEYDAEVALPTITSVVNAADGTSAVAPGGLIIIQGTNLSATTVASSELPLTSALGETCLTVNGVTAPMILASPTQINAQMPAKASGSVTMILRTAGGTSDSYLLKVQSTAPALYSTAITDNYTVARIVREANGEVVTAANPIRSDDTLTLYLTGMGATSPAVADGVGAPSDTVVVVVPTVTIGGTALNVMEAGLVAGSVGVNYIKVQVPYTVPKGMNKTLQVTQGSYSTSTAVRVIN